MGRQYIQWITERQQKDKSPRIITLSNTISTKSWGEFRCSGRVASPVILV